MLFALRGARLPIALSSARASPHIRGLVTTKAKQQEVRER